MTGPGSQNTLILTTFWNTVLHQCPQNYFSHMTHIRHFGKYCWHSSWFHLKSTIPHQTFPDHISQMTIIHGCSCVSLSFLFSFSRVHHPYLRQAQRLWGFQGSPRGQRGRIPSEYCNLMISGLGIWYLLKVFISSKHYPRIYARGSCWW